MNSYTFHITVYDLFFFGMIFIGLNFAVLLAFVKSVNRAANRFLALALLTMILWMMQVLAIDIRLETYLPGWDRLPMQFLLALGPLIYFYVLKITRPAYQFRWKDLLHFIPLLLEQGALALEAREVTRTGVATYTTLIFQQLNPVLQLLIFISIITYLYRSHKLIEHFYRRLQPVLMDRSRLEFRWLRRLLAATALLWLLWISFAVVDYLGYRSQLGVHVYYPFYIFFAVIIIWTAAAAFLRPHAGWMVQPPAAPKPPLTTEQREKGSWLKKAMQANRYYRDPELSVSSLADELDIPPHELSRIINTALKKNFNDFINEYRIREVILKIQDPAYDHITLLGIAYESGFNSKTTFNRTFRQMTGKNPAEYKRGLKKERPFSNLGRHPRFAAVISNQETTHKWLEEQSNRNYMFRNYLKTAWRNLVKHRFFSFISITGLAIGLCACILIIQYVSTELNVDRFHKNLDNLYRVVDDRYQQGSLVQHSAMTYSGIGRAMKQDLPEVEAYCRVTPYRVEVISWSDKKIADQRAIAVDASFLSMFTYPLLAGDQKTALLEPNSIIISEKMAREQLGVKEPRSLLGQVMVFDTDSLPYKITGICKDVPDRSQLHFDLLISYNSLYSNNGNNRYTVADYDFTQPSFWQYIQLRKGADPQTVERKFAALNTRYFPKAAAAGTRDVFYLQPLRKAYLYSDFEYEIGRTGSYRIVWSLLVIAFFILVLAWVNYINLATARSLERAKEVGIRKVTGASRMQLIKQFLTEALLVNLVAIIIAVFFAWLLQSEFNQLVNRNLSMAMLFSKQAAITILFALFTVAGIFFSGFYPAFILSGYNPLKVLRGTFAHSVTGVFLRKSLVTAQFAISILLIIGSLVIYRQLRFMTGQYMGYNMDQMMVLRKPVLSNPGAAFMNNVHEFIQAAQQLAYVKGAAASGRIPGQELDKISDVDRTDIPIKSKSTMATMGVDTHFINLYQMKLLAGRNFSPLDYHEDLTKVHNFIINVTALRQLHFQSPQEAIGKSVMASGRTWYIIGVVADFHQQSLRAGIEPVLLLPTLPGHFTQFSVKVDPQHMATVIKDIRKLYDRYFPENVFDYYFLDEKFNRQYSNDYLFGKVFGLFAALAILIACLGLSGLSLLTAMQRTKEVGIRKVLGASVPGIVLLLSKDFIRLVLLAIIIASPVAWYIMHVWLQDFAYRVHISWWIFASAGLLSLIIALLVIGFQTVRTAVANPAKSLRTE
ncbi:ABC transporter permease [Mucilaginibacter sabulilitoris]|uniref:ABC transporter permease n=1 Tax=Mucilaginibacter sabulilitoris TaxID=1173583 RepID=A0ABZ0TIY7_9SPHI|nr:ABC transporter permease [Mucilaginibacter sabulilitoris]WPU93150.1 ABC transporter permease [Mucilaginibacter sabulilitoris]